MESRLCSASERVDDEVNNWIEGLTAVNPRRYILLELSRYCLEARQPFPRQPFLLELRTDSSFHKPAPVMYRGSHTCLTLESDCLFKSKVNYEVSYVTSPFLFFF